MISALDALTCALCTDALNAVGGLRNCAKAGGAANASGSAKQATMRETVWLVLSAAVGRT